MRIRRRRGSIGRGSTASGRGCGRQRRESSCASCGDGGKGCGAVAGGYGDGTFRSDVSSEERMRSGVLFTGIAFALVLLPACTVTQWSGVDNGRGADGQDALAAPEGYRAELHRTPWALDRVSKDGAVVWVRTAESGCNRFHHVSVRQVPGGFRLVAFDVVYIPTNKRYGCLLYLLRPRHRVELPRPLGSDKILGECIPRDPRETCALLHAVVRTRKGAPERDPWLG